jgi:murein DD-endopeptidase MepM/ murein hydrolase activator NlpD
LVKATLDGTVIMDSWTLETGYVIQIQHEDNLISVYKHNAKLLKRVGEYVRVGDPIAIVGNSGELTTGPHLHFELWHKGAPLNPEDYISF